MNRTAQTIDISICPTNMEINGDILSPDAVEKMIRDWCAEWYPDARVAFQVGHRQGDEWYRINGRSSEDLGEGIGNMDWSDESLYEDAVRPTARVDA